MSEGVPGFYSQRPRDAPPRKVSFTFCPPGDIFTDAFNGVRPGGHKELLRNRTKIRLLLFVLNLWAPGRGMSSDI